MLLKRFRALARVGAAVGAAGAVMLSLPAVAGAGGGQTPGTYAFWSAPENPASFTIPMTLQVDPGDYNALWSTQFDFTGVKAGGYFGFQTHRNGGGMFLASIWNAASASPGSPGSYCKVFHEGGAGPVRRRSGAAERVLYPDAAVVGAVGQILGKHGIAAK